MENIAKEMNRVKSLTPPVAATKIPQVRSTPLKKVSDIRGRLERERTFTKEAEAPESSPKLRKSPQKAKARRQWTSFGGRTAKSDAEDDYDAVEDVFRKTSDAHFERLREDLAEEGTAEAHLEMAEDLLADLEQLDGDEVRYRQEQAMFWTMKAAERGSGDALRMMRVMFKNGVGVTESNRAQVSTYLSMTKEELVGQRIGKSLFKRLSGASGGGSFVTMSQLEAVSRTGNAQVSYVGEDEVMFATKREDRIGMRGCVKAGTEHVGGRVPSMDERLFDFEQRVESSWNAGLHLRNAIAALQRAVVEFVVRFHFIVLFALYKLLVSGGVAAIGTAAHLAAVPLFALHNAVKALTVDKRRRRWENVFNGYMDEDEKSARKKKERDEDAVDSIRMNLIATTTLFAAIRYDASLVGPLALIYAVSAALNLRRPALLIALASASAMDKFSLFDGTDYLDDYGIPPSLTMMLASKGFSVAAFFIFYTLFFGANFGIASLQILTLIFLARTTFEDKEVISDSVLTATVIISGLALVARSFRTKKYISFDMLMVYLIILGASTPYFKDEKSESASVSWVQFREICPQSSNPVLHPNCLEMIETNVNWKGIVAGFAVSEDPSVAKAASEIIPKMTDILSRNMNCDQGSPYVCHIIEHVGKFFQKSYEVTLEIRMKLSMYREETVVLVCGPTVPKESMHLELGDFIEFDAVINSVGDRVDLKASSVSKL